MRISGAVLSPFTVIAALFAGNSSIAQESCLPALKQDTIALDRARIVDLSVLDKKLQDTEEDKETGVFATYGDFSLDFDQSKQVKDRLETLLDIDYTESERELLRSTTLSRDAVDAYLGCLTSKGGIEIAAAISPGAVNSDSFFLTFYWNQRERPKDKVVTAELMISQGYFRDTNSFNMTVPIQDREGTTVRVVRNRFEPSEISIEIPEADPTVITVPKVPSVKLVPETIQGERFDYGLTRESSGEFGRDICVYAPSGGILVPNSFRVLYTNKIAARVTFKEGPIYEDPLKACRFVGGNWDTVFKSSAQMNAQAIADILKTEPVPEALNNEQQPPPELVAAPVSAAGN